MIVRGCLKDTVIELLLFLRFVLLFLFTASLLVIRLYRVSITLSWVECDVWYTGKLSNWFRLQVQTLSTQAWPL